MAGPWEPADRSPPPPPPPPAAPAAGARPRAWRRLLHVGAAHRIPLLGDRFLARLLLVKRRENRLVVRLGRRQLRQHVGRHLAILHPVIEPDRMAVGRE